MKAEKCPGCASKAVISLSRFIQSDKPVLVDAGKVTKPSTIGPIIHVGKKPDNALCLCCRMRWHVSI